MARITSATSSLLALLLVAGCRVEDRGRAQDAATLGAIIDMRDTLECHRGLHGGYPQALRGMVTSDVAANCAAAKRVADAIAYGRWEGESLHWFSHVWRYSPTESDAHGRLQRYQLAAADTQDRSRYHSFWVDSSGTVRSARGREAGATDPAESVQRSFFARPEGTQAAR
jgi:hypothetical protein